MEHLPTYNGMFKKLLLLIVGFAFLFCSCEKGGGVESLTGKWEATVYYGMIGRTSSWTITAKTIAIDDTDYIEYAFDNSIITLKESVFGSKKYKVVELRSNYMEWESEGSNQFSIEFERQ